jgi:murein DD-endopeptidase MepM/ murein hydrolase activator NlpD
MKTSLAFILCCLLHIGIRAQDTFPAQVWLPLRNLSVTSVFGFRIHPLTGRFTFHAGVDLRARHDTVFAVLPGTVTVGYDAFLGVYVKITTGDLETIFGHLSLVLIAPGEEVFPGTAVAITGATGRVTGEHLHFSVKFGDNYIDPLLFLASIRQHTRSP